MKPYLFLLAIALGIPSAIAFNCTPLNGEEYKFCNYIEDQNWPQKEKDIIIQDAIDSDSVSLKGNFKSTLGKEIPCQIQLNKPKPITKLISDDNRKLLIEISKISLLGFLIYIPLKKYYLKKWQPAE